MISSPDDYAQLDVEHDWARVHDALAPLRQAGRVRLERLEAATLTSLRQRLRRDDWHVFHYIGHGGFDPHAQDGVLVLQDQTGRARLVSGQDLGVLLHDHDPLRLVVLNACEGARSDPTDPFAGTAQSLIQQGIPAVVAMQFEITDPAAITFAHELYGAIADSYPLDAAVAEARKAIWANGNQVEWATPVLYLRAPDGRIFHLTKSPTSQNVHQEAPRRREVPSSSGPAENVAAPRVEQTASFDETSPSGLTPADVEHKEFSKSFRGHAIHEVDAFLDQLQKELPRLQAEVGRRRATPQRRGKPYTSRIRPADLEDKKFTVVMRGYTQNEVDDFLVQLLEEFTRLYDQL